MSIIPDKVPDAPEISVPSLVVKSKKTRGLVAMVVIFSQIASMGVLGLMEIGFLPIVTKWLWIPWGVFMFTAVANPFLLLAGWKESASIVLFFVHLLLYVQLIRPESFNNALILSGVLLIVVMVFEVPRRVSLK